jgi:lipopolysaccharide transport system ATP-binding protein
MSGRNVITVKNLSKRYLVGHETGRRDGNTSFREKIGREVRNLARKSVDLVRGGQIIQGDEIEEFWALRNVSFEIKRGEVIGIIGRNGAGKSTLLKILSRITEPTEGRVTISGRVASLLEVGTGFHPELSGRENIYLNGAILGMTRVEIKRKFDEIVAFAEVERFLDTPVKRFSSGMYVRLAFAIAAHLEPDILVVDEVLAVGDIGFQTKCLGKMEEVAEAGRTVLLVSHNTHAVRALCSSAIALDSGRVLYIGETDEAIRIYNDCVSAHSRGSTIRLNNKPRALQRDPRIQMLSLDRKEGETATLGLPFNFEIEIQVSEPIGSVVFGVGFCSRSGARILSSDSDYCGVAPFDFVPGRHRISCSFQSLPLGPGDYLLDIGCRSTGLVMYDEIKEALSLEVLPPKGAAPQLLQRFPTCLVQANWERIDAGTRQ